MAYYSHVPQYLMMQENGVKPSERLVFQDDAPTAKPYNAASLIQPTGSQQEEIRRAAAAYLAEKQADQPDEPEKPAAPAAADERPLPEDEMQRAIVQFLRENGDTYADDIASALDLDLSALLSALTELELDGYAESLFGKQYRAV
jgi:predicted Rossmann fold nucleotide-binding protein DprA/Smf involved in DNA uptake